jgi:SAM-dependent methyltransferase
MIGDTRTSVAPTATVERGTGPSCRFCGTTLRHTVVDLGMSPLCESYPAANELDRMEPFYPLLVHMCQECLLVQLREYVSPTEIFGEYAYFSSFSDSWLRHARRYVDAITTRLDLGADSLVVELGSNDGYLLQYFRTRGIPVLGIEPAANVAQAAIGRGVPTRVMYFGRGAADQLVNEGVGANLIVANNVLAQVPDINGFVEGIRMLLRRHGVATLEFPHLVRLIEGNQFDTIYHEHFSYFSFLAVDRILSEHGLTIFDVEELLSHGGSLRIFCRSTEDATFPVNSRVDRMRTQEEALGLRDLSYYEAFRDRVIDVKRRLLDVLIGAKREGLSVAGYGAPGKGNTLLNFCGIRKDFLDYTVDRNPYKQGRFLPGTHIPIVHPDRIPETKPDLVLILPWNLRDEIIAQLAFVREWGGRFLVPIPDVEVVS